MNNFFKPVIKTSQNYKAVFGYRNYQFVTDCARVHALQCSFDYGDLITTIEGKTDRTLPESIRDFLAFEISYSNSAFFRLDKNEIKILSNFLKTIEKVPDGVNVHVMPEKIYFSYKGTRFYFSFLPFHCENYADEIQFKLNPSFLLDLIKNDHAWYFTLHKNILYFKNSDGTKKAILCPLSAEYYDSE